MKVGLTGGIASGKSTVSKYLKELGALIIDADKIAHSLMKPEKKLWQRVVEEFGEKILLDNNTIDRKKLGEIIFNNSKAKARLDEITHPIIIAKIEEEMEQLSQENDILIVDVPLLIEADMIDLFDEIWLVYVDQNVQVQRLMDRDKIDYQKAISKINSQMPLEEKKRYADRIISNNGTEEELKAEVMRVWQKIS
ncbi:dephospho-CoA kinase [Orenia metallireducens]|uniref:Dephospho-CoA kinase n=1 Tax=Orenia metallireducens TaxID=1413210 RepID=A0A285GTU3_9FIRM|nr:dephospho-CoA kinase [Orenia metallireducens]PRX32647.1 dephospho-CoA kinase [Orenia metallireducens]SNY26703.1 dephospho-CoA kinase [Orenia metallireducens]